MCLTCFFYLLGKIINFTLLLFEIVKRQSHLWPLQISLLLEFE